MARPPHENAEPYRLAREVRRQLCIADRAKLERQRSLLASSEETRPERERLDREIARLTAEIEVLTPREPRRRRKPLL
jgi:hypothetical protein